MRKKGRKKGKKERQEGRKGRKKKQFKNFKNDYLIVYKIVPFLIILKSLFGAVILCETDFFPFLKKVSGVHTFVTIILFNLKISIGYHILVFCQSMSVWRTHPLCIPREVSLWHIQSQMITHKYAEKCIKF